MEIEEFASGSVFASGRSHLDFATQDQIVFNFASGSMFASARGGIRI